VTDSAWDIAVEVTRNALTEMGIPFASVSRLDGGGTRVIHGCPPDALPQIRRALALGHEAIGHHVLRGTTTMACENCCDRHGIEITFDTETGEYSVIVP
jgi:hypothetical protein